jgi:tetratricopeptide (TPR) repeat protein
MAAIGTAVFVFIAVCVSYRATRAGDERRAARRTRRGGVARAAAAAPEEAAAAAAPWTAAGDAEADDGTAGRERGEDGASGAARTTPGRNARRSGWAPRVVASAALLLLAASWLPPYLALRAENAALAASSDGDVATALDHARRAAAWDPLAVGPLITEATLLQQLGRNREALERLQAATKLQPQNFVVWYELGVLQHGALGRDKAARAAFTRALALNPDDAASRYELEVLAQ